MMPLAMAKKCECLGQRARATTSFVAVCLTHSAVIYTHSLPLSLCLSIYLRLSLWPTLSLSVAAEKYFCYDYSSASSSTLYIFFFFRLPWPASEKYYAASYFYQTCQPFPSLPLLFPPSPYLYISLAFSLAVSSMKSCSP